MANISNSVIGTKDCYGCGLCIKVCKKNVLNLHLNESGFFETAAINVDACVNCGLCKEVCSFNKNTKIFNPCLSFAGWSNNIENRKLSSSGGVAYEISKAAIGMGYSIICVRYNIQNGITAKVNFYQINNITKYKTLWGDVKYPMSSNYENKPVPYYDSKEWVLVYFDKNYKNRCGR